VTIADENSVEKTWSKPLKQAVVDYCNLVVWHVGSLGGLAESSVHSSMLWGGGGFPTLWMDFWWLVILSCDGCI
jgi:hypothetical protein